MSDEGDDSPPPRPRRNIKRIVLASSSGSESDDSGPATSTRKKRLRVLSDEDSESSGSSVVVGNRRRRALPKLRDSDGDSDSSGWATERSGAAAGPRPVAANPTSGFASDSSEGNSDKCSICLMRFTDQQVGTPQTCEHIFCLDCITEWSRNVNTCPVDRMTFDCIVVRACAGGRVLSTQPVTVVERPPSVEMLLMEDFTSCEICGSSSSEDTMLLCDGCDLGFHMECLTPPLTRVPTNQWLCPSCNDRFEGFDVVQISGMDELFSEEEGGSRALGPRARRPAPGPARRPAAGPAPRAGPSSSRAAAPRARARKRHRRRTVIIEYELEENGKFPVTKRIRRKLKRRKTKRRQPRTAARRALVRESVRAKLAAQAGVRAAAAARLHAARASLAPPLSLFGSPHDLDYFSDDEPAAGGGALAARAPAAPACLARAARRQARRKLAPSPPPAAAAPDLLDAILESQTLLHARRPHRAPAPRAAPRSAPAPRVDVRAASGAARQAPSYGQPRNGGGWGGGYRYPAERAPAPGAAPTHAQYDNGYGAPAAHAERRRDDGEPHAAERARYAEQPATRRRPEPAWPPRRPPRDPPPADKRAAPAPDDEDAGLVIDTDKYDPTEPTDDDDAAPAAPAAPAALPAPPALPALLDSAVRQVLLEHRGLVPEPARALSDDGSDGDCPNFSIYSATSVHIASGALAAAEPAPPEPAPPAMHDLVQEDDADEPDAPPEQPAPAPPPDDAAKRKTDEYNEKVSKRCPITTNTRNPIKIKLNTPALIRRQVSLYDEEDVEPEPDEPAEPCAAPPEPAAPSPPAATPLETDRRDIERTPDPEPELERDSEPEPELEPESEPEPEPEPEPELEPEPEPEPEPDLEMEPEVETADDVKEDDSADRADTPPAAAASREKMTESISETEDERSYTPCLDEHRDDRDALDGLDTELISEDEGHGLFSEDERREPAPAPPAPDLARKKKKKDAKREAKERKGKKRADVAFKKAAKAKERHYRERDSGSGSPDSERRRKREKRKDLERYDVRTLVSEKRRRTKDAFGRDVSPEPPHRASAEPEPPPEPRRARAEPSPRRARASPSPRRGRASPSPRRPRVSPSPTPPPAPRRSASPRAPRRRRSASRGRRASARRRRSGSRGRKRRRSGSAPAAAKPKAKKKKRARSARSRSRSAARRKSPKRKRVRRRSGSARRSAEPAWSPRPASPRTPPPQPAPPPVEARRARKRRDRSKHRRPDNPGPSKEVFTSGDNILVSVSFKEAEGGARRPARRRRRAPAEDAAPAKPVAIIDLERSPFRELTPSPERVIVLSDDERPAAPEPPPAGPKTPPEPGAAAAPPPTPPEPPDSPDAYDPYEPTASPAPPDPPAMTLEAAQKTNLSADDVLDRRPLEPIEKVMALLQSTREAPPEPPPDAGAAPEPPPKPKPFAAKPSPIKSDPIKPMPQTGKVSRLPLPARGDSPYSPGSSDFGDLFEPPPAAPAAADEPPRRKRRQTRKKGAGKTQVDVKLDDDNLKVLDELPSSAVELQVKSKFLKKLNRQERVVEEVKLVLKPHYNKKRVSKDEYKHILRRAVPKICHNKTGEINPTKIQALVEAYVKKFRKKHKLGLS